MSGVLDRLAMKAMGALGSVQPVIPARYSGSAHEPEAAPLDAGREQHTSRERAHAAQQSIQTVFQAARRTEPVGGDEPRALPSAPAEHKIPDAPALRQQAQPAASNAQQQPGAAQTQLAPMAPERRMVDVPRENSPSAEVRSSAARPQETSGLQHSLRKPREEHVSKAAVEPVRAEARLKSIQSSEDRPALAQRAERKETSAPVPQQPEIRISIGTIELRAARAENKPAPPAFRPRVSLDDFLKRKPEGNA